MKFKERWKMVQEDLENTSKFEIALYSGILWCLIAMLIMVLVGID